MIKPLYTIDRPANVGIWENQEYLARIYADKIIVISPYVKWANNTGTLDYRKNAIRDQKIVDLILQDLADECEDDAWAKIDHVLSNYTLNN